MVQIDAIPKTAQDVIGRNLETETVLVLTNQAQVKVLNEVGAYIWSLIDGQKTIREIAACVSQAYAVSAQQSEADTLEFVTELEQKGAITFVDAPKNG